MIHNRLRILYATVSGTAKEVAEALSLAASADQPPGAVTVQDMHDADSSVFDAESALVLLVVSTTGSGDVPPDGLGLFQALREQPRYLGGLRYGVIALGDSSYGSTFCGGGRAFDEILLDLGAQRISDMLLLDAIEEDDPAGAALRWFEHWSATSGVLGQRK